MRNSIFRLATHLSKRELSTLGEEQRVVTKATFATLFASYLASHNTLKKILLTTTDKSHRRAELRRTILYALQALHRLNVAYAMRKPCEIHALVDRIRDMDHMSSGSAFSDPDPALQTSKTLLALGFLSKHLGYTYLQQAIVSIAQNPEQSFTKEVYPAIAAAYNCEQSSVEHAIRTSISCAWKKGDNALWLQYFPQDTTKALARPTNSTFITRMAGELRLKK